MAIEIKRPLIWITIAYAIGIALSLWLELNTGLLWMAALFVLMLAWVCRFKRYGYFPLILIAFLLVGMIYAKSTYSIGNPLGVHVGERVKLQGVITDVIAYNEARDSYVLKVDTIIYDDKTHKGTAFIRLSIFERQHGSDGIEFKKGDIVEVDGIFEIPRGRRNPAGFDYRNFLSRRGIHYIMSISSRDIELAGRKTLPLHISFLERVRDRMHNVFSEAVGGREGDLMIAMMLGDRWLIPDDLTLDFQRSGLSHILAISGLHVGFVLVMLNVIFGMLPITAKWGTLIKIIVLWFYCLLTGASPSVLRAVFMATLYLGGQIAVRKPDALNCLFAAALGILVIRPLDLFDIGFQLSFAAVLGIVLFNKRIEEVFRFLPKWISSTLVVTLAAQIGVGPIIAYHFNMFSIVSFPANLIFVPLSGIMVIHGFIVMVIGLILPAFAEMIGWPLKILGWLFIEGASLAADVPMAFVRVVSPSLLFIVVYYAILWILSDERPPMIKKPAIWCASLVFLLLGATLLQPILTNNLKIVFLDVGQGDSIYIQTPDERHILIDAGGRLFERETGFEPGRDVVLPFLLKNGVNRLDLVVMSHDHADHIGGLEAVVSALPIGAFMEYKPADGSSTYKSIKEILYEKDTVMFHAFAGQVYNIGKYVSLEVFYPDAQGHSLEKFYDGDENNRSLVFLLRYKDAEVMFTGDIYRDVEQYISNDWDKTIDILKVAHHGSFTSTSNRWLKAVNPALAVIQVGENNFGHPHDVVLQRLSEQGVKVLRNDLHGAVVCVYDDKGWTVRWVVSGDGME